MRGRPKKTKTGEPRVTPVMQQFADAKAAYPDAIILFRLGDFYEMFHDDAVLASGLLGIALTSRNKERPEDEPMAGVPHHSVHQYVTKLLAAGHKVAFCEQLVDPKTVKGIVPRAVVRVLTPGLVTADGQIDARQNHYLCAIEGDEAESRYGLARLDLSTAELSVASCSDAHELLAEVARAAPKELLLGPGVAAFAATARDLWPALTLREEGALSHPPHELFERAAPGIAAAAHALPVVLQQAVARAVDFAARCMPNKVLPVTRLGAIDLEQAMQIDETAQAHLELVRSADGTTDASLLASVDETVTSAGARLLRRRLLSPLLDPEAIRQRLDSVDAFFVHGRCRSEFRAAMRQMSDLERTAVRVRLGDATPRDLGLLRDGLAAAAPAIAAVALMPEPERLALQTGAPLDPLPKLGKKLQATLVDKPPPSDKEGGVIADGVDKQLEAQRRLMKGGTELLVALETRLREETGAQTLRVRYNSVFGWYIEVTKSQLAKVPKSWHRKQTIAGGERYTTEEVDQLAADLTLAEERAILREQALVVELFELVRRDLDAIESLARMLADWDVAAAFAELAAKRDFVRPVVDNGDRIRIEDGRHPVVERFLDRGRFVPNDTDVDLAGRRLWLVTGPNMAGKSTLMRQVALITLLAQVGSFVPARAAQIGVVDRLLSRVGASDNLARGESTFMVEMRETANILRRATRRSFVILDEIGRGTSTYDGLAIAWAVAEHLHDVVACRALFATHYHELTELSKTAGHLANVSVSAREHDGSVVFLHRLQEGAASQSYGIAVARLAGLPEKVLTRAQTLLASFEKAPKRGREEAAKRAQLGLFEEASQATGAIPANQPAQQVIERLRAAPLESMTPLAAMNLLAELRAELKKG